METKQILLCVALGALGCGKTTPTPASDVGRIDMSPAADAALVDAAGDVGTGDLDQGAPPVYELLRSQPPTSLLGERRGRRLVRGLIHAHSIHSHDACDGNPELADGTPNEPCLDDFRKAICETRMDYVFLTEHEELAALKDFETLMLSRGTDTAVTDVMGRVVGNMMACENGHQALLMPGGEFGLMPIGMPEHLPGTVEERDAAYNEETAERAQSYKDLGAVVLQAHAESKTRDDLRNLGLDGFEVYQLHANVDPDIRADFLGLDGGGFINAAVPFVQGQGGNPDLLFLTFVEPNRPSLAHFDALVSEGQHLTGTGGTDCHQNVLRMEMTDGERVDGYRRMMRWFSNHLLVDDLSPDALRSAVRDGRLAIVFEVLGTPDGDDFRAESAGSTYEMGDVVSLAAPTTLHVARPDLLGWGEVPVRIEILKIEAEGAVVVADGVDSLTYEVTEPGAYRAIVYITPTHLAPHFDEPRRELASREYEWIWFNPIYVE